MIVAIFCHLHQMAICADEKYYPSSTFPHTVTTCCGLWDPKQQGSKANFNQTVIFLHSKICFTETLNILSVFGWILGNLSYKLSPLLTLSPWRIWINPLQEVSWKVSQHEFKVWKTIYIHNRIIISTTSLVPTSFFTFLHFNSYIIHFKKWQRSPMLCPLCSQ